MSGSRYMKRDRLVIAAQIIRACPDCFTHIMHKTNLAGSIYGTPGLVGDIIEAGLITKAEETDSGLTQKHHANIYRATEKGLRYAKHIEEAAELAGWKW